MASLSLPRVLQLKKNSLDAEREHFEKFQTLAIQKAINSVETPVKEKHVRSTIIGTFQEQSAITYWMVAVRLPLQDNRIVAWKFCHVTHKLLREGHPACLDDSQRHIPMIENLGKLWVHLREGYGKLVHLYCALLVCKLRFHARNPRFPPNMHLTADELDAIAENDVNNYFQLCVELFDYMDDILTLQAAVFDSLGNARANSMTASGQCRLAALIPCAQDSSQIYDCNVRLLFRLHASLPPDTLAGHRERFWHQFKKLSQFYKHASSLQYYRNLLTLPVLPSNPPNFLQQSDFGTYVTPVVTIPEPSPEDLETVGSLVDTSDSLSQTTSDQVDSTYDTRITPSPQPDPVVERDKLIDHLQNELKRMRSEVTQMVQERTTMVGSMREHCSRLESQLHTTKTDLDGERQKAELLYLQTPEIKQKLTETEEKAKLTDEKFQKLKGAYTLLREEHIKLIRQKAEVDKMSASLRAAAAEHESAKTALHQQLNDKMKDVELLQQSTSSSEEIEAYKSEIANLRSEIEHSRQKDVQLETLRASMEALEIEHKTATTESEEKLNIVTNELKDVKENLENLKKEKEERDMELKRVKEELVGLREKSGDEYTKAVQEKEAALKQIETLIEQNQLDKQEHDKHMLNLQTDLKTLQLKLNDVESRFKDEHEKQLTEIAEQNKQFEDILLKKDSDIKVALLKLHDLEKEFENYKSDNEKKLQNEFLNKDNHINNLKQKVTELSQESNEKQKKIDVELEPKITELSDLIVAKELEIGDLQNKITEINDINKNLTTQSESLFHTVTDLKSSVEAKYLLIEELTNKLDETGKITDRRRSESETQINQYEKEIADLKYKLQHALEIKDDLISDLKKSLSEKDERIIALSVETKTIANEVAVLEEDLNERNAELEIAYNELEHLKKELESIILKNEENLAMKNEELRSKSYSITKLSQDNIKLSGEKEAIGNDLMEQKQVYESKIKLIEEELEHIKTEHKRITTQKADTENKLNEEIQILLTKYEKIKFTKDYEIQNLNIKIEEGEERYVGAIKEKDLSIQHLKTNVDELKAQLDEVNTIKATEKKEFDNIISAKNQEVQMVVRRLQHVETEKLTAECELQDLLQNNTALEEIVGTLKQQLEDAQKKIADQRQTIVQCVGDAALEVTNLALSSLERGNSRDSNRAATDLAARAFEELAAKEGSENVEEIARSAILAAHNTATLSTYVTEVTNITSDIELSDRLTNECRMMLNITKQCLESVKNGSVQVPASLEASRRVLSLLEATSTADTVNSGPRSVDDELADMDRAIEEAATQMESILAASRKGDSGVKLEVNGKILDACTTLMGAVKILVQDARKLQNELGDPKTRQKMYRRNPQWSEGLISAAKAVVFAAKLLVSSADEAVGASGRVEGVSAAAHEVAGSTAQLVAASRARAPPSSPGLARLTQASRSVAAATGAVVAAVRAGSALVNEQEALDTTALTLTATRILEMECKVRSLELETSLEAERARLAALRKRHYQLQQEEENGVTNGQ